MSDDGSYQRFAQRGSTWANVALVLVSSLIGMLLVEIGYRISADVPIFQLTDWRAQEVAFSRFGDGYGTPDPVLGWVNFSSREFDGFGTIEHGIRRNFEETTVRTGGVLAVGDSFTEGWEVADSESWPAELEAISGVPVINAGVSGYGSDQIVLRAEQMLPIVKPKILIVGLYEEDILRAGYSTFNAPKPYFTIEDGELRYHPPGPLEPHDGLVLALRGLVRGSLGYRFPVTNTAGRQQQLMFYLLWDWADGSLLKGW